MCSAKGVAAGFSISGLLDESSKTRERFPVAELDVDSIAGHPDNIAYSMDEGALKNLADSIRKSGLTDLPLVRKLDDGSFQMISGHRRLSAFRMLSVEDSRFSKIPVRIVSGITDDEAVMLLHTANYFVRSLTVLERARATEALGLTVDRLREEDPKLAGVRSSNIKAAIMSDQTGRAVSGKSIQRDENLAKTIGSKLSREWAREANEDNLSASSVQILKELPREKQARLYLDRPAGLTKRSTTEYLRRALEMEEPVDKRLVRAIDDIRSYTSSLLQNPPESDIAAIAARRFIAFILLLYSICCISKPLIECF